MRDRELYARLLGIEAPWRVEGVELKLDEGEVVVQVEHGGGKLSCLECGRRGSRYDTRQRRWRHLDTCQYRTVLEAGVPRVECEEHKVRQVRVPWGEERSRFTALYEGLILDWLQQASIAGVAGMMGLSWDEVDGVMRRGVERGLARRQEQRKLPGEGAQRLKGSRYLWLKNPQYMDWQRWKEFAGLRDSALQTARAWGYKEHAMTLWDYRSRTWARKAWQAWVRSASRCRLEPVKRVARMVRKHLEGILTAVVQRVTNARAEGINSSIQWLKYRARGYHNRQRFRDAIYFHFGALDVYPKASLDYHLPT